MSRRLWVPVLVALLPAMALSGEPQAVRTPCATRIAEKLGVRFVQVCGAEEESAPFWISVAPMPCAAGEHETIDCPSVSPLLTTGGEAVSPALLRSRQVAVVDTFSAHRLCALRFAGHVATRAELERARASLGLAALVVAERSSTPAAEFRFEAVPEWTEDGDCENPSVPGERCRFRRWPSADARHAPMDTIRACDARPVGPGDRPRANAEIGGRCPAEGWTWDGPSPATGRELPCGVRVTGAASRDAADFVLTCRPPGPQPPRAPTGDHADIAAFRCVVPTWALATFEASATPDVIPGR